MWALYLKEFDLKHLLLVFIFCASNCVLAQDGTHELAKRLYIALDTQSQIDAMAVNMQNMAKKQIASVKIPEKARPFVEKKYDEIYSILFDTFKSEEIQDKYIEAFAKTYTEAELKSVVEFFESPAGKAYISKAPVLQKMHIDIAQSEVATINPSIVKIQQEIKAELSRYE